MVGLSNGVNVEEEDNVKIQTVLNKRGVTLIELLVALVIGGIVIAGIYRLFVAQTKAYSVQDQVVEVQQNIRSAMETLLRDLRVAGFDDDSLSSTITISDPIIVYPADNSHVTINYEYLDPALGDQAYSVDYSIDADDATLVRQLTKTPANNTTTETILENVNALNFTYGLDQDEDGNMDDQNEDAVIDDNDWVTAAGVGATKVVAVRVALTARPEPDNPDIQKMVSPRSLVSTVTLRNQCLVKK